MFPAHKGAGHRRRRRGPIAAGVAALGAGVAGVLLMTSAHAGTPVQPPEFHAVAQHHTATKAQLSARVAGAITTDRHRLRSPLSAPTGAASGTSTPKADPKIIGGTTTTLSTAPWMAQLWYSDDATGEGYFCGGTVVSPTKILTAAHCVAGLDWFHNGVVVTGTDQLPTLNADNTTNLHGGRVSGVLRQWNNPSFSEATVDDDVAVLTLDTQDDGPLTVKPLAITTATDTASYTAGTTGTVYGWGRTSSATQDLSQTLKKAQVSIASNSTCSAPTQWGGDFIASHMVCVGPPASGADAGTTSACNGDSGGPLVVAGKLVGTVSYGVEDCVAKGAYSVYSRVGGLVGSINPRLDDSNLSGDDKADLIAVATTGTGYLYDSKGTSFATRAGIGDYSGLNLVRQADLDRDGYQDLLVRTTGGKLYFLNGRSGAESLIGAGWNALKSVVTPGDLNGDGLTDLVAVDTTGTSWFYPGNGKGWFGARSKIGTGWNTYAGVIYGKGDLTGDGRADLVARDSSGALWLYKGTGSASAPWAARTKVGSGWNSYNAFAAVGDVTGDGHADLLARDTSGILWLYKGTGSATAPYAARVKIGGGWNTYSLLG